MLAAFDESAARAETEAPPDATDEAESPVPMRHLTLAETEFETLGTVLGIAPGDPVALEDHSQDHPSG